MISAWDGALLVYVSVACAVFIACNPVGVVPKTQRDRFMQCFTALLAAVFWPVPVGMFAMAVGYVILLFMVSLVVERK